MYKKIMVPYDSSKPSDNALEHAVELAKAIDGRENCEILLVPVVPEIPSSPVLLERPIITKAGGVISLTEYVKQLYEEMTKNAQNMLEEKKKEFALEKGLTVRTVVTIGRSTSEAIHQLADKEKVDLIIIGNVGLSGISKLKMLGSVSRAVSERANCPVMIVH
jgi:nucleotide-binding universal stress UspA family protein